MSTPRPAPDDRAAETLRTFPAELARLPHVVDRLLAEHRDDGHGRCRTCTAGHQAGRVAWPCRLYATAAAAGRLIGSGGSETESSGP